MVKTYAFFKFLSYISIGLLVLGKLWIPTTSVFAQEIDLPPGFYSVTSIAGVHLYRKDYPGGTPDYVQVVNLSQGASLHLLHSDIREARAGKGVYGGSDPRFGFNKLKSFWNQFSNSQENAFCVLNGLFFYMKENPTRLPFPLKVSGKIITDGYAIDEFIDQKFMLEIWDDQAAISQLTKEHLYSSTAPDIIAGLSESANKRSKHYTGRTFIGVDDQDGNGVNEIVFIFNTKTARQVDAAEVLRSFGADEVMMLDGGGSTQLICEGKEYVSSDRLIPQAIGVSGGSSSALLGTTLDKPTPTPTPPIAPVKSLVLNPEQPYAIIKTNSQTTISQTGNIFQVNDIILIPLLMLPVEVLLVILILKIRELYSNPRSY